MQFFLGILSSVPEGDPGQIDAPLWMGLLIHILFTTTTAGVFCWIEGWDFGTSLYFQYITFLTIGFGDVVPSKEEVRTTVGKLIIGSF